MQLPSLSCHTELTSGTAMQPSNRRCNEETEDLLNWQPGTRCHNIVTRFSFALCRHVGPQPRNLLAGLQLKEMSGKAELGSN